MKKANLKRLTTFLMTAFLSCLLAVPCLAGTIQINLDGRILTASAAPYQENGTTLVPLRLISENLGAAVSYDNKAKKITISSETALIELTLGSTSAKINGAAFTLALPAQSINGTTMVPLRFISENLNCQVSWDAQNRLINITSLSSDKTDASDASLIPTASLVIQDYGTITLELYPDMAPNTVNNFIYLANEGFYDGLTFHRIIDNFMIQGGDPQGTGTGGPGYSIPGEFASNGFASNTLSHTKGVISMARSMDPDSAGSQFFITSADAVYLDGNYAAFGKVTSGIELLLKISAVTTNASDMPLTPVVIESIRVNTKGITYKMPVGYRLNQ